MASNRLTADQERDLILSDDEKDLGASNNENDSDIEPESGGESDAESVNDDAPALSVQNVQPACGQQQRERLRGNRVRGRGAGRGHVQGGNDYNWLNDKIGFDDDDFDPTADPGPRNIPTNLSGGSEDPFEWLSLFWTEKLWQLLVMETNNQVAHIKAAKPNHYYAKGFYPVTVREMKAFFGCRVAIEMLIKKTRHESYWRQHYPRLQ